MVRMDFRKHTITRQRCRSCRDVVSLTFPFRCWHFLQRIVPLLPNLLFPARNTSFGLIGELPISGRRTGILGNILDIFDSLKLRSQYVTHQGLHTRKQEGLAFGLSLRTKQNVGLERRGLKWPWEVRWVRFLTVCKNFYLGLRS